VAVSAARVHTLDELRSRVLPVLMRDVPRNNLLLGVVMTILERPAVYPQRTMATVEEDREVVAAVVMTPPFDNALVSDFAARRAEQDVIATAVASALRRWFTGVNGVTANTPVAGRVAGALAEAVGGTAVRLMALGGFAATRVIEPPAAPGRWRPARQEDRALVLDWYRAFSAEAHHQPVLEPAIRQIDSRLQRDHGGIDLWESDGAPVSLCAFSDLRSIGARIGPVYTSPDHRRRGFAGALVAATTGRLLREGRPYCFLNTDLANPTSNHVYTAIGYEWICDAEEWRITMPGRSGGLPAAPR
jgi:GNAT superfamily N-acetyltransferase